MPLRLGAIQLGWSKRDRFELAIWPSVRANPPTIFGVSFQHRQRCATMWYLILIPRSDTPFWYRCLTELCYLLPNNSSFSLENKSISNKSVSWPARELSAAFEMRISKTELVSESHTPFYSNFSSDTLNQSLWLVTDVSDPSRWKRALHPTIKTSLKCVLDFDEDTQTSSHHLCLHGMESMLHFSFRMLGFRITFNSLSCIDKYYLISSPGPRKWKKLLS